MGRIGSGGYTALRWEGGDLWWECVHEGGEAAVLNLDAPTRPACPWQRMLVGKRVGLHIADDAECALLWLWLRQFTAHVSVLPADGLLRTTIARARGLDVLWTHDVSMRVPNVPVMAPPDLRHFRHRVSGRRADEHHARSPRIWAVLEPLGSGATEHAVAAAAAAGDTLIFPPSGASLVAAGRAMAHAGASGAIAAYEAWQILACSGLGNWPTLRDGVITDLVTPDPVRHLPDATSEIMISVRST
jgi:hypothetical protein